MSPRTYRSTVRARQKDDTRATIVEAARDCFLEQGFTCTSVADIARRAGVSPQTVYVHAGSKAALVATLLTRLEDDADAPSWRARVQDATDARERLQAWAGWSVAMLAPARTLKDVYREAATDPSMLAIKREGDARRRNGVTNLVHTMHQRGELAPDMNVPNAIDHLWILTSLEVYLACIDCGWDDTAIHAWLTHTLQTTLLPQRPPADSYNHRFRH